MNVIDVDTMAIRNLTEKLRVCHDAAQKTVDELTVSIESLQSMWTGEAHDEFVITCMKNRDELDGMCKILENIIQSMSESGDSYDQCEEDIRQIISSFRIS